MIRSHGDIWGETWVNGEFKCSENDNPLFRCPTPGKPCPHRLKLPAGINCQFHRTDKEWNESKSVEALQKARDAELRRIWEEGIHKYPGWNGICPNLLEKDMPDGSVRRETRYRPEECIHLRCQSTQCVCRNGAERDLGKANIFYDLYVERRYTIGMIPYIEKSLTKGMKVFDRSIAKSDAEIVLKIWKNDPDSPLVPMAMSNKLNAYTRTDTREAYFIRHHGCWNGHVNVEMAVEIRNIRIAKSEARDMIQDLQDVRDGIEVEHDSDNRKAAKQKKSDRRKKYKVGKLAKAYVRALENGMPTSRLRHLESNEEIRIAALDEARKIAAKHDAKRKKEAIKAAQITIFDMEGGVHE